MKHVRCGGEKCTSFVGAVWWGAIANFLSSDNGLSAGIPTLNVRNVFLVVALRTLAMWKNKWTITKTLQFTSQNYFQNTTRTNPQMNGHFLVDFLHVLQ